MNYRLDPAHCPTCQEPLQLTYPERRYARLQPLTILLRALIILAFPIMFVVLLVIARFLIANATEDAAHHLREKWMFFPIVSPIAITGLWLLTRMCWRCTRRLAHRTLTTCQECGWSGPCLVKEAWML